MPSSSSSTNNFPSSSSNTNPFPYESPFSSRDHLLADHHNSSSNPLNPLNSSSSSHGQRQPSREDTYTEMAWFTIRHNDDNWTRRPNHNINHSQAREMTKTRRLKLLRSYAFDWVLCIVLAVCFFALDEIPGFKRQFSIEDTSIRFPYAENERVPPLALYFICGIAPLVIQIAVNLLTIRSLWDFHNSCLGLLLSLTLTGAVTQFTKVTVGRPRPDVISRCQPPSGIVNPEYGLVTVEICTQTDVHIIRDGFRSFPSGHSSLSFAGLGFLSFYLAGKMHLFDEKGHTTKAWISLAPFCGAALVAISRTMDYRHHWQDVLVGSLIGLIMSFFAYRQYYPPLNSPRSHRPFSPRIRREGGDAGAGGDGTGMGMEGEDSEGRSPSEESRTPILPVHRPGAGMGGTGRKNGLSPSPSPVGGAGGRSDEDGGRVITHPAVPHIHPIHGGHPSRSPENVTVTGTGAGGAGEGGYLHARYQDEQVEDLQRGSITSLSTLAPNSNNNNHNSKYVGSRDISDEQDGLELDSPYKGVR